MYLIPQLLRDYRLVSILDNNPILLRSIDIILFTDGFNSLFTEYNMSEINHIVQQNPHGHGMPVIRLLPIITLVIIRIVLIEIGVGIQNALTAHRLGNPVVTISLASQFKNISYYLCGRFIND